MLIVNPKIRRRINSAIDSFFVGLFIILWPFICLTGITCRYASKAWRKIRTLVACF